MDKKIVFVKDNTNIYGYTDADWANDINDRKSYTGYDFKYEGGAISWEAKKQHSVSLSSTEEEYVAISQASKEVIFIKGFLEEFLNTENPILIYNDNQSAQKLVSNPAFHNRIKHINVKYHFVREVVGKGQVKYIPTNQMIADIFTTGLHSPKHKHFVNGLGLM